MLFLGCLFRKEQENEILKLSNIGIANAGNIFQWNLINGLDKLTTVDIINVLPVGTYPKKYKKLFLKTEKWGKKNSQNNLEIGSINIPVLKQFIRYKKIQIEIKSRIIKRDKIDNIIIYSTYLPFLKAIYKLDKKTKITLIVTDLPEFYDLVKVGIIEKILRKINNKRIYQYLSRVDSFVLLTELMKIPLKVGNRPYVVVEGLVDNESIDENNSNMCNQEPNKKVILYTGALHYQFGIKNLLEAFKKIDDSDYELWICGAGEVEQEIKQLSIQDKRIKFYGYLTKQEVNKLQQQATVLINPRPDEGEYTKYSFPSKTMEYMLSEKPVIMYKLDGIPDEYDNYLYYINGNKPEDIAAKIIEVCEKNQEERNKFGEKARKFVIENKNSIVQAEKILKMIQASK